MAERLPRQPHRPHRRPDQPRRPVHSDATTQPIHTRTHHPGDQLTDDEIAALVALRPDTEPFTESVAHVAYWTLVDMQDKGAPSTELVATIVRFAEWKKARLAEMGDVTAH